MNNILIVIVLFAVLSACADSKKAPSTLSSEIQTRVSDALAKAKKENDTRLWATKGRRLVIVGIDTKNVEQAKKLCGIKFLPESGDVLRSKEDRLKRQENNQFSRLYNQSIYDGCMKVGR